MLKRLRIPQSARRDLWISLLIGLFCFGVYNANGRAISAGDAYPARYQPFAIWAHGTVFLDPIETVASQGRERPTDWQHPHPGAAFWMVPTAKGHVVSLYAPVLPLLISPLYLPTVAAVALEGWSDQRVDRAARIMEKLVASLIAALSVALLYLVLRRRTTSFVAILLTVAYAFGTTTWTISSQALWQHGMAELLMVGLILLLTVPCTAARAIAAGLLCGLIAGNRPADAVLAMPLGIYGLVWAQSRRAVLFGAAALLPVLAVVCYNLAAVGALGGAYQLVGHAQFFRHDMFAGLAGLLFSPTRGLLVFCPFLLFLVLTVRNLPHDPTSRNLTLAMIAGVVLQILLYSKTDWRAGISWGPRFLTDLLPLLMWLLVPVVENLRRVGRICFLMTVGFAISIEAVGAFAYTGVTDVPIYAVSSGPNQLSAAWAWRNAPFVASLSQGFAPAEIATPMRGTFDRIALNGASTDSITAGQDIAAEGWALAGHATPLQVGITIDGRDTTAVRTFFDRPDVRAAFPGTAASGWRIPIKTANLAPGIHRLALYLWASEKGDAYFIARRTLTVKAGASLETAIQTAAARIREHQQHRGYWLTDFTQAPRFEKPGKEMNIYTTSMMVDLLDPLSGSGFAGVLQLARRHLTSQIESTGLVRYHGLPDAPGIGTLGCRITPDTDDTALVWRIAPAPDRHRLTSALSTIGSYRTAAGLYQTWLAPRAAYQCLDPGADPDPADIGIQMHLLQLLLKERPVQGHELCEALQRHINDDGIWVYYRLTPLDPILRRSYLEQAGCHLDLPTARIQAGVPGQQIWLSVVNQLSGESKSGDEATSLLNQLAADDFALLRRNPPLLYHNDVTATVPRYYWSEDAGYALWLQLAQRAAR